MKQLERTRFCKTKSLLKLSSATVHTDEEMPQNYWKIARRLNEKEQTDNEVKQTIGRFKSVKDLLWCTGAGDYSRNANLRLADV
jgi:RNase P subunit RPR2